MFDIRNIYDQRIGKTCLYWNELNQQQLEKIECTISFSKIRSSTKVYFNFMVIKAYI